MRGPRELTHVELTYFYRLIDFLKHQRDSEAVTMRGEDARGLRQVLAKFEPEQIRIAGKRASKGA